MLRGQRISVVIPCYNEERGVAVVLARLPEFVDEVIVVDNNSSDRTAEVAAAAGARVVREPRQGYGRAYKSGLAAAGGDIVVTMDGDATYPEHAIQYLVDTLLHDELDFVSAARIPIQWAKNWNMIQRFFGNLALSMVVWALFQVSQRDSQSGMWIFRRRVLADIMPHSDGMAFSEEIKIRAFRHPRIAAREVPIQFKYVARVGCSKLNLWHDGMRNLKYLFRLRLDRGLAAPYREVLPAAAAAAAAAAPEEGAQR